MIQLRGYTGKKCKSIGRRTKRGENKERSQREGGRKKKVEVFNRCARCGKYMASVRDEIKEEMKEM